MHAVMCVPPLLCEIWGGRRIRTGAGKVDSWETSPVRIGFLFAGRSLPLLAAGRICKVLRVKYQE